MDNTEIKQLLTAFNFDPENDAVKSFFERDNIWKILDVQRYEPSHSAFLVWFFSQKIARYPHLMYLLNLLVSKAGKNILSNGWNATNDMKEFANAILTGSYSIKTVAVTPELVINKLSNIQDGDRLDVFIDCAISLFDNNGNEQEKTLEIIIENKVDSPEGNGKKIKDMSKCPTEYQRLQQTERYYYACSKEHKNRRKEKVNVDYQFFVFLTPDRKACKSENYVLISYQNIVDYVFENFLRRKDVATNSRNLIEAYLHNLGNPFNKNKSIIAMTSEERELLVNFYNRNKQLFETMIEALIQQAKNDGDDETAEYFKEVASGLKKAGTGNRYYYQINTSGSYSMWEVIREFIIFRLKAKVPFSNIYNEISKGVKLISDTPHTVSKGTGDLEGHTFEYEGKTYYVSNQLRNKDDKSNFRRIKDKINKNYPAFQITEIIM